MLQNKFTKKNVFKHKAGFAMLFAVLVSSLLLSIGISIFNISLKELLVSTSEKNFRQSFYVADSAFECARFNRDSFPYCTNSNCLDSTTTSITCNGFSKQITFYKTSSTTYEADVKDFLKYDDNPTFPVADIKITTYYATSTSARSRKFLVTGHDSAIEGKRTELVRLKSDIAGQQ